MLKNSMASKTSVAVSYGSDSASATTDDDASSQEPEESSGEEEIPYDQAQPESSLEVEGPGGQHDVGSDDSADSGPGSGDEADPESDGQEDSYDDTGQDDQEADGELRQSKENTDKGEESDGEDASHSGLANVMASILKKKVPEKKSAILAKAKTDREIQWRKRQAECEAEEADAKQVKTEHGQLSSFQKERERHIKVKQWEELAHVKPHVLNKEKERRLQRIATRGVVQLFNAVKKQQKSVEEKLKEVGSSEAKREKVMKSVSKGAFLDMLKGTTSNVTAELDEETSSAAKQKSKECRKEGTPTWSVLRDDFMMGAEMKDWDKESEESDAGEPEADIDMDYSDEEHS